MSIKQLWNNPSYGLWHTFCVTFWKQLFYLLVHGKMMELHGYGYFRNNKQFFSRQDVKWLLFKITQNILLARAECLEYIPCILELEIKAKN